MHLYSAIYDEFDPFRQFYDKCTGSVVVDPDELKARDDALLIVWGGSDIHPSLYGRPNNGSHVGHQPSQRDLIEYSLMKKAIELGIPIIGVCRGAQMLCAVAGGKLAQHVTGHEWGDHSLTDIESSAEFQTSSVHHQMMYPYDDDDKLLGTIIATCAPLSKQYRDLEPDEVDRIQTAEPEIVWFDSIKGLAIQGHPEYKRHDDPFNKYVKSLMEKYV